MKKRQIIYSSTIIVLGIIQLLPCVLLVSSTINGLWFSGELYISTLRLEKFLLGCNVESD